MDSERAYSAPHNHNYNVNHQITALSVSTQVLKLIFRRKNLIHVGRLPRKFSAISLPIGIGEVIEYQIRFWRALCAAAVDLKWSEIVCTST